MQPNQLISTLIIANVVPVTINTTMICWNMLNELKCLRSFDHCSHPWSALSSIVLGGGRFIALSIYLGIDLRVPVMP
jgi:hypothetical protein